MNCACAWEMWEVLAVGIMNPRSVTKFPVSWSELCPACHFLQMIGGDYPFWVTYCEDKGGIGVVCSHAGYPWPGFPDVDKCLETYGARVSYTTAEEATERSPVQVGRDKVPQLQL